MRWQTGGGAALAPFPIWNTVFSIVFPNTVLGVQLVPEVLVSANTGLRHMIFNNAEYHHADIIIGGCLMTGGMAFSPYRKSPWDRFGCAP